MKSGKLLQILLSILMLQSLSVAQYQTNFERIDSLVSISANKLSQELDIKKTYSLEFISSNGYKILESKLIGHLQKNEINLAEENEKNVRINYNFDEAKIKYDDVYRDGLFGTYMVERIAKISGSFFITENGNIGNNSSFEYTLTDSVLYSDISSLENIAYTFTSAEIPEEPFFSSTLEPIIAISSAAVAVYLFFNIRSK